MAERENEAQAMEHLGIAIAHLRAAASLLMRDHERNTKEIAEAINTAASVDDLMKVVGFNLAHKR